MWPGEGAGLCRETGLGVTLSSATTTCLALGKLPIALSLSFPFCEMGS